MLPVRARGGQALEREPERHTQAYQGKDARPGCGRGQRERDLLD